MTEGAYKEIKKRIDFRNSLEDYEEDLQKRIIKRQK
jgi:hypothetical protein